MRTFELRVYTLRNKRALDSYVNEIYPRHLDSFPLFGIEAHGFWTAREDVGAAFLRAGILCGGRRTWRGRSAVYAKR